MSDEELMVAYQLGDYKAFEELYRRHSRRIYGFLRSRVQRRELVDEVYQLVFMKLHKSKDTYDPSYPFVQWLFVLSKTVLLDFWRKQGRQTDELSKSADTELELPQDNSWNAGERVELALPALESMSAVEQEIVKLRVINELSYNEIAEKMNRSQESVRQIVSRTMTKLRKTLKGKK